MPLLRDCTKSEKINSLSDGAEILFYRLMMKADDYGNFFANPALIKAECFPLKENIRTADIVRWLKELSSSPSNGRDNETSEEPTALLRMYEANQKPFLHIFNFGQKHKYKKRKVPPPEFETETEIETEIEVEEEMRGAQSSEKTLDERKKIFFEKINKFEGYSMAMRMEFYDYWTEKNDNGRKMRFELQKVFDTGKRLKTWERNQHKFTFKEGKENKSDATIAAVKGWVNR